MYDDIPIIHQHPVAVTLAFYPQRADTLFFQKSLNVIVNGTDLSIGASTADDKGIGNRGQAANIQYDQSFGFFS